MGGGWKQALTGTIEKEHDCRMLSNASGSLLQETLSIHLNRCAGEGKARGRRSSTRQGLRFFRHALITLPHPPAPQIVCAICANTVQKMSIACLSGLAADISQDAAWTCKLAPIVNSTLVFSFPRYKSSYLLSRTPSKVRRTLHTTSRAIPIPPLES